MGRFIMFRLFLILGILIWLLCTAEAVPYLTVQQGRLFGETIDFNEDGKSTLLDVFKVRSKIN